MLSIFLIIFFSFFKCVYARVVLLNFECFVDGGNVYEKGGRSAIFYGKKLCFERIRKKKLFRKYFWCYSSALNIAFGSGRLDVAQNIWDFSGG